MRKFSTQIKASIKELLRILIIGSLVFGFVNLFLGQLLEITGESMYPTYKNGEQIISEKISLRFKELKRGEVVIFEHPKISGRLVIKRVIGLPGETWLLQDGVVHINGVPLAESYVSGPTSGGKIEIEIPEKEYIVLGDNRSKNVSMDSRIWGTIKKESINSRAMLVYYPFNRIRCAK